MEPIPTILHSNQFGAVEFLIVHHLALCEIYGQLLRTECYLTTVCCYSDLSRSGHYVIVERCRRHIHLNLRVRPTQIVWPRLQRHETLATIIRISKSHMSASLCIPKALACYGEHRLCSCSYILRVYRIDLWKLSSIVSLNCLRKLEGNSSQLNYFRTCGTGNQIVEAFSR